MIFEAPLLLALAPVVALIAFAAAFFARRRRVQLARAWSASLAAAAKTRGRWAPALLALCALLAGVAVAGPRGGQREITTRTRALSLVFAVDISRSMLAEDVAPNRLRRAVREVSRLVQDLRGDRLGLIAFAGRSYILAPLTIDGSAVRLYLDALHPELASQGGTSLSAVLKQGAELLAAAGDGSDRVLVVFTDGETHDTLPDVRDAAETLRDAGVRLVLVAEGSGEPARIPVRDSAGTVVEYQRDEQGSIIVTQRRDDILQMIAEEAEATIVAADLADQAGAVRDLVAAFKRAEASETRAADLLPRAWIPALAAALLLLGLTFARRGGALIALALFVGRLEAQRPSPGQRALDAGQPDEAAAAFLQQARAGRATDTAFYNAGTAALAAGRYEVAKGALGQAARSLDPDLRYRALYNLGLAALLAADADTLRRDAFLNEAVDRLREALLLAPASERAKWNLELARRQLPPRSGGGGGGQGGGGSAAQPPEERRQEPPSDGLSRNQAEQILNSMEREESATRRQQRRPNAGAAGIKDW